MQTYIIHHKIDTLLELWKPFEYDGFKFEAWSIDYTAGRHDGWIAQKTIKAHSIDEAFRHFSSKFHRLVDRIAFVGQCHTTIDLETFVITKPGDKRFFWRYSEKRGPVPLNFTEEKIQWLAGLERYEEKGDVFRYLREATNASSFYTMLVMLVSALEAMAGTTDEKGRRKVDKKFIASEILNDEELCARLFRYGGGLRNQVLHGGFVDDDLHGGTNYNGLIYEAVVGYFNEKYGLEIGKSAKGTPRTVVGNYDTWMNWCEWMKDDTPISLRSLNENFRAANASEFFTSINKPDDF